MGSLSRPGRGITSYRDLAALLRELASSGGVTVQTCFDDRPAIAAATTVGLDGTFVVAVNPALRKDPALWERHCRAVEARLSPLTEPRAWFARIAGIASWIAAVTAVVAALTAVLATDHPWKQALIFVVPTTVAALARALIRPISARVLSHLLGRSLVDRGVRGAR